MNTVVCTPWTWISSALALGLLAAPGLTACATTTASGPRSTRRVAERPPTPRDNKVAVEVQWPPALRATLEKRFRLARLMAMSLTMDQRALRLVKLKVVVIPVTVKQSADRWRTWLFEAPRGKPLVLRGTVGHQGGRSKLLPAASGAPNLALPLALGRAVQSMRRDVLRRFSQMADPLHTGDRVHLDAVLRRRPDGKLDGWIIGRVRHMRRILWGLDFRYRLSADGRQILRYRKLHRQIRFHDYTKPSERNTRLPVAAVQDRHGEWEGVLPTSTDIAQLLLTRVTKGFAVMGRHYFVMIARNHNGKGQWYIKLFKTRRPLRRLPDQSVPH